MKCKQEISFEKYLVSIIGIPLANILKVAFFKGNKEKKICLQVYMSQYRHLSGPKLLEVLI